MLQKSAAAFAATACFMFAVQAEAADVSSAATNGNEIETVVVIGAGETRSVSTLLPANLDVLPPGTSVQKALNFLPGVMAQSIDALGVNEQSLTLQVRGFSTTHLGYTLDGMPLGDGAYNNYNGLTISRALISENLGRADLATGIAGLSIASTSNLGGAVTYVSSAPHEEMGFTASQSVGSEDGLRTFVRFDTGEYNGFSAYFSGQYSQQDLFVHQGRLQPVHRQAVQRQAAVQIRRRHDHGLCGYFRHQPGRRSLHLEGHNLARRLGFGRLRAELADLPDPRCLFRALAEGQLRQPDAAGKYRRRLLHQRSDHTRRLSVLSCRRFRYHRIPARAFAGVSP